MNEENLLENNNKKERKNSNESNSSGSELLFVDEKGETLVVNENVKTKVDVTNKNVDPKSRRFSHITIKDMKEKYSSLTKSSNSMDDLISKSDVEESSTYEVLYTPIRRMYLKIFNLTKNNYTLVYEIINRWCEFANIDSNQYYFAKNEHSKHNIAYHIFFPYKVIRNNMLIGVTRFKLLNKDIACYVSEKCYNVYKFARLPEQKGHSDDDIYHTVRGSFNDCVIQNIDQLPLYKFKFSASDLNKQTDNIKEISKEINKLITLINDNNSKTIDNGELIKSISSVMTESIKTSYSTNKNIKNILTVLSHKYNSSEWFNYAYLLLMTFLIIYLLWFKK